MEDLDGGSSAYAATKGAEFMKQTENLLTDCPDEMHDKHCEQRIFFLKILHFYRFLIQSTKHVQGRHMLDYVIICVRARKHVLPAVKKEILLHIWTMDIKDKK